MPYGNINVDTVTTSTTGGILGAGNASIMKNRIINGAMVIDQRNAGASSTAIAYTVDRWNYYATQASKGTWQQNAGSVTPPIGFSNYLGFTSSSAYSVLTGDEFGFSQTVEGYNIADLGWGTANAKTITLSFWVRSSLTGTFGGSLRASGGTRSYPFSYTISAANTWEYETITIAGDTGGTWLTTNGAGIIVNLSLGAGSTYSGTAGAWSGSNLVSATGATSVVGTSGATWYVTGVQLEVGSSATGFEYVNYQTSLANCQRYYWQSNAIAAAWNYLGSGLNFSTTGAMVYAQYPVQMRSAPSVSTFGTINSTNVQILVAGGALGATAVAVAPSTEINYLATRIDLTSSGLTSGQACIARFAQNTGVTFSAEL
jgi:hypothetical protein